jgi:putative tricarboxylic transport membrane protein
VTLALLGAYALNSSTFDLQIALAIGILGFLFRRFGVPLTPLIIGLIMGPLAEVQFKRALQISNGDYGILIEGFLPKALYTLMFILLLLPVIYKAINKRKQRELVS